MPLSVKMIATISEKLSKLVNKNEYEPRLCKLMNASQRVFPGRYEWIADQPSGECDFVEHETGKKYDAKLPFTSKHGKLIGSRNHDFKKWLELMRNAEAEFGEDIIATRGKSVTSLELYKIIDERLGSVQDDENVIFFFPYPIVLDGKDMMFFPYVTDFLGAIFNELRKQDKIKGRDIFVIYPACDGDIVLRCLNDDTREYIRFPEFDDFIAYNFTTDGIDVH